MKQDEDGFAKRWGDVGVMLSRALEASGMHESRRDSQAYNTSNVNRRSRS